MLLRRITKHVENQNWFAVTLDFFIVLTGILIAFQITSCSERRSDRALELDYLERLSTDLASTIERNEVQLERNSQMLKDLEVSLKSLKSCELTSGDRTSFISGLYLLGRYNLPEFVAGTFEELNTTGNFQLIRNLDLRRNITNTYETVERVLRIDRQVNDNILPKINYVRRYISFNPTEYDERPTSIDPNSIEMDFEAICSDRIFINSVSGVREMMIAVDGLTKGSIWETNRLKMAIDEELERLN